eukprot:763301-Hanusia_phi.AAC.5
MNEMSNTRGIAYARSAKHERGVAYHSCDLFRGARRILYRRFEIPSSALRERTGMRGTNLWSRHVVRRMAEAAEDQGEGQKGRMARAEQRPSTLGEQNRRSKETSDH